ncbi:MAG: hypothetical protein ACFCUI_00890 [Bernardetiaceae bacterium]
MKTLATEILHIGLGAASLNADRLLKFIDRMNYDLKVAEEEGKKIVSQWETQTQERKAAFEGQLEELSQKVKQSIGTFDNQKTEDLTQQLETLQAAEA